MSLSLSRVLGPEIRVNEVCPGLTQTRWNKLGLGKERYEALKTFCEDVSPLRLVPTAGDIADAILYFIKSARVITGGINLRGWKTPQPDTTIPSLIFY